MDLTDRTTFTVDVKKFVEDKKAAEMEIVDQPTKQKLEKEEENGSANNEKQEGARSENCLMGEVKVKNQFLSEVKKNRKRMRKSYIEHVKLQMREYFETKSLQAGNSKCKKHNVGEAEKLSEVNGKTFQPRKPR